MDIKVTFDNITVKEDKIDTVVKILMLKGEKGDQGDGENNVIEEVQVNGTALPVSNKAVNVQVPTVDSALNSTSENPVQNKVIYNALGNKVNNGDLSNYYQISEIDNLLNGKVDTSDLDDYYTKTSTYSKDETNALLYNKANTTDITAINTTLSTKANINDVENTYETIANHNSDINALSSQITSLASGSPLVASSTSGMTDTTRTYVNTSDGNWYYYNGTNWVQGGVYQAIGIDDGSINFYKFDEKTQKDLTIKKTETNIIDPTTKSLNAWRWNGTEVYVGSFGYKHAVINVTKGEKYHIKGGANPYYPLYIYTDNEGNLIEKFDTQATTMEAIEKTFIASEDGLLYINTFPDNVCGPTTGERIGYIFPKESIEEIIKDINFERDNWENDIRAEQIKNDFEWKKFDKVYVSIVIDDNPKDISAFQSLFETENVPLCLASPPSTLSNICVNGETVKQVMQKVVTKGGEILTHGFDPLTSSSTNQDYIEKIVKAKKILFENGFNDINGIITIGGTNYLTANFEKCVELMRPYYKYSDLYGTGTGIIQYYHPRKALSYNVNGNRNDIASAITEFNNSGVGSWVVVYCHGTIDLIQNGSANNETDVSNAVLVMKDLIDWIKSKSECEILTYKEVYEKFKTSKLEKRISAIEDNLS